MHTIGLFTNITLYIHVILEYKPRPLTKFGVSQNPASETYTVHPQIYLTLIYIISQDFVLIRNQHLQILYFVLDIIMTSIVCKLIFTNNNNNVNILQFPLSILHSVQISHYALSISHSVQILQSQLVISNSVQISQYAPLNDYLISYR